MSEERSKLVYAKGAFLGRTFKKKGVSKDGREWKLYDATFLIGGADTKFQCFANPRKGLSVDALMDGEEYTIGYSIEPVTFTGTNGETVCYDRKTIAFITSGEEQAEKTEEVVEAKQEDLLSEEPLGVTPIEQQLMDRMKQLDQVKVTEQAFKQTVKNRLGLDGGRVNFLWKVYNG